MPSAWQALPGLAARWEMDSGRRQAERRRETLT
jgi:hypothetical protein